MGGVRHVVVVGGGAALARPVMRHFLGRGDAVTAVCRETRPGFTHPNLRVVTPADPNGGKGPPADVLVTLCGRSASGRIGETDSNEALDAFQDNLIAPYFALHHLAVAGGGNVVVVGSIQGSTGGYGCAAYAAAKAGLVGLVRAAANEWAARDVCVNLLELGYVDAGMGARLSDKQKERALAGIPLRRFATEDDVVQAVDYLARVRYMTGGILTLAGGLR